MPGPLRVYRPNYWRQFRDISFKSFIVVSFVSGAAVTVYSAFFLGKHYLFDNKKYKAQRKEYSEALQEKGKREKELGLRD